MAQVTERLLVFEYRLSSPRSRATANVSRGIRGWCVEILQFSGWVSWGEYRIALLPLKSGCTIVLIVMLPKSQAQGRLDLGFGSGPCYWIISYLVLLNMRPGFGSSFVTLQVFPRVRER